MASDPRPEPLCGLHKDSFAFLTIRDRLPEILTKVVDLISRTASSHHADGNEEQALDAKEIVGQLSKLKNEMQTDKELRAVTDSYHDADTWNLYLKKTKIVDDKKTVPSWFSVPWLTCECYLYRRIFEALQNSSHHKTLDPFFDQKSSALFSSQESMATLADYLVKIVELTTTDRQELRMDFEMMLEYCLWGNKCDLSLSGGKEANHQLKESSQLKNLLDHILSNDTENVWKETLLASSIADSRMDIVLDNSGFELYTDLCLAEFMLDKKLFSKVCLHVKDIPWFVSDASKKDVEWTIEECAKNTHPSIAELGRRWQARLNSGALFIHQHSFWTLPHDFSEVNKCSPELYSFLADSQLVVFKGDLNYRKLIGDRNWPHTTLFQEALHGFHPAPICSLRTLKADLVVGLAEGKAEETSKKEEKWMVNGQYAVIQFCGDRK